MILEKTKFEKTNYFSEEPNLKEQITSRWLNWLESKLNNIDLFVVVKIKTFKI